MAARASLQPDPARLIAALDLRVPLIGFYDAPEPEAFAPLVAPKAGPGRGPCVFHYYRRWLQGDTLHLTASAFGCGGCGRSFFGVQVREREDFIDFLWKDEGLRASRALMAGWDDNAPTYAPEHGHVLIGPLRPALGRYLRTVTFWANPDQLSALQHGAYHHHAWGDPDPVTVPFGSGCSELVVPFRDLEAPQAVIGGTDVAMRGDLPADLLAFTVTVPLFAQLCALGDDSFLGKGFLARLRAARGGCLG
ncbi:MAG: DUF169 domain-containing protein [Thermoleophilia bacterium]